VVDRMQTAVALVIIILLLVGTFFMYRAFMQKALRKVVSIYREQGATDPKRAKSLEALGLQRPGAVGRMFRPRDYKQSAMRLLAQEGAIRMTEGEKFYLSEDGLANSRLKQFASIE
jgi:hypothetical protein